eukprot:1004094-Pyramimonas_sp.AAC.1
MVSWHSDSSTSELLGCFRTADVRPAGGLSILEGVKVVRSAAGDASRSVFRLLPTLNSMHSTGPK